MRLSVQPPRIMSLLASRRLLAAAAVAVLAPVALHAQAQSAASVAARPISFGISGGAALVQGDLSDAFGTGFIVGGHLKYASPTLPVGFRADVNYSRNGAKEGADANLSAITGFANAVFTFAPQTSTLRPYVLGGLGFGRVTIDADFDFDDLEARGPRTAPVAAKLPTGNGARVAQSGGISVSDNETGFAFQIGAGLEIPLSGITGFGEIGYQRVSLDGGSLGMIPIRFGVRF